MTTVTIETNAKEIAGLMGRLFKDQIPFALSRAINDVAKEAQTLQRVHQRRIFTVRRPQFVDQAVKIKPFATKKEPSATIRIEPPGGPARADILTKFETDTVKRPRTGQNVAIPSAVVKRTSAGIVRRNERPSAMHFRASGSDRVLVGDRGTVLIRTARGGVILRTKGKGAAKRSEVLYYLKPQVRIVPELHFVANVTQVVARSFEERFSVRFHEAVKSAR